MKIFKDKPWEGRKGGGKIRISDLCPSCQAKFRNTLRRDGNGNLNLSTLPKACDKCKEVMKNKMESSKYPDRG
jgi:hypothetical protein